MTSQQILERKFPEQFLSSAVCSQGFLDLLNSDLMILRMDCKRLHTWYSTGININVNVVQLVIILFLLLRLLSRAVILVVLVNCDLNTTPSYHHRDALHIKLNGCESLSQPTLPSYNVA